MFKQLFKSLYSPKYIAAFRMQGIGKTINYLFFLALLMCVPMIVYLFFYITSGNESMRSIIDTKLPVLAILEGFIADNLITIPIVLIIYYLLVSFLLFVKVSIFGAIGLWMTRFMKKRAEYRHIFRMAAYAVTLPSLLIVIIELAGFTLPAGYLFDWLLTLTILAAATRLLPSRPK
nr:DUF1189 family protein [Domibacillus epiphyticus]